MCVGTYCCGLLWLASTTMLLRRESACCPCISVTGNSSNFAGVPCAVLARRAKRGGISLAIYGELYCQITVKLACEGQLFRARPGGVYYPCVCVGVVPEKQPTSSCRAAGRTGLGPS